MARLHRPLITPLESISQILCSHQLWQSEGWVLSAQALRDSMQPHGLWPSRLLCPWDSPGKNTGVGFHALLQGIFPTQGSNPSLPHSRWILYHLSHQGSPFPGSPLIIIITNPYWAPTVCQEPYILYPSLWALFGWEKITSLFLLTPNGYSAFPSIMSIDGGPQYCQLAFWFVIFFKFHIISLYCFCRVHLLFFFFLRLLFIYFLFLVCWVLIALRGLSLVLASRGHSSLWCAGFSLWQFLLWSTGSRAHGLQ